MLACHMNKYKVKFDKGAPNVMNSWRTSSRCEVCHKDIQYFQRAYYVETQSDPYCWSEIATWLVCSEPCANMFILSKI